MAIRVRLARGGVISGMQGGRERGQTVKLRMYLSSPLAGLWGAAAAAAAAAGVHAGPPWATTPWRGITLAGALSSDARSSLPPLSFR